VRSADRLALTSAERTWRADARELAQVSAKRRAMLEAAE
jgi:hypothetical protein